MDNLVIIFINLVIIVALFIYNSRVIINYNKRYLEKRLNKELNDNIKMAIEYINDSINLINNKQKSIYQMLQILQQSEKFTADKEKPEQPSVPAKPAQDLKLASPIVADPKQVDLKSKSKTNYDIENVLAKVGEDKLELQGQVNSLSEAYQLGRAEASTDTPDKIIKSSEKSSKNKIAKQTEKKAIKAIDTSEKESVKISESASEVEPSTNSTTDINEAAKIRLKTNKLDPAELKLLLDLSPIMINKPNNTKSKAKN